ncbi:MAG: DUF3307 domain-containing protein [Bacillota bacterium]|nr:DUF3307 domain-containing protein [Bacillota bacterium]
MSQLSDLTVILLICQLLGDYQLCIPRNFRRRFGSVKAQLRHVAVHAVLLLYPFVLCIRLGAVPAGLWVFLFIIAAHFIQDLLIALLARKYQRRRLPIFCADQLIHVIVALVAGQLGPILLDQRLLTLKPFLLSREQLNWLLLIIMVTKPANVLHELALGRYAPLNAGKSLTREGAGALIGNLERLLSVIFLAIGQPAAIGLVCTAKSIARFKQIEEDKGFAEYYLIGTLYSILYAIVSYYLVMHS